MISASGLRLFRALETFREHSPLYSKRMPLFLPSRANSRDHHFARARTAKMHVGIGTLIGKAAKRIFENELPFAIRIVREAPNMLDDDNAQGAGKSLRDGIAKAFGINDRDPRVTFFVDQALADEGSVLVEFYEEPLPRGFAAAADSPAFATKEGLE